MKHNFFSDLKFASMYCIEYLFGEKYILKIFGHESWFEYMAIKKCEHKLFEENEKRVTPFLKRIFMAILKLIGLLSVAILSKYFL